MMDENRQLKLQAFLDGELSEGEAREVAAWIEKNPDAAALQLELKHTGGALAGFEKEIKLPESREFFWSKIEREIKRQERVAPAKVEASPISWLWRVLIPTGGVAIVALMLIFLSPGKVSARPPELEAVSSDSGAFTYRDEQTGTTVVWLSYGSENGLADKSPVGTIDSK